MSDTRFPMAQTAVPVNTDGLVSPFLREKRVSRKTNLRKTKCTHFLDIKLLTGILFSRIQEILKCTRHEEMMLAGECPYLFARFYN